MTEGTSLSQRLAFICTQTLRGTMPAIDAAESVVVL